MELFAADGHDAGGCERVTGKSGMRPCRSRGGSGCTVRVWGVWGCNGGDNGSQVAVGARGPGHGVSGQAGGRHATVSMHVWVRGAGSLAPKHAKGHNDHHPAHDV